jgi:hypothetical protein
MNGLFIIAGFLIGALSAGLVFAAERMRSSDSHYLTLAAVAYLFFLKGREQAGIDLSELEVSDLRNLESWWNFQTESLQFTLLRTIQYLARLSMREKLVTRATMPKIAAEAERSE